jgi:hypothetical protein
MLKNFGNVIDPLPIWSQNWFSAQSMENSLDVGMILRFYCSPIPLTFNVTLSTSNKAHNISPV